MNADVYFALAAATLAFLVVNLPPARTFMGDGGSVRPRVSRGGVRVFRHSRGNLAELVSAARFPAVRGRRHGDGAAPARARAITFSKRTERIIINGCTRWGRGIAARSLFYGILIVGTCASALFTLAVAPGAGWSVLAAWVVAIGGLFAGIDYHWRRRTSEQQ